MDDRRLCGGLIRLQVLRHAAREHVCGLATIEESGRHGCGTSAGTLHPILHGLEDKGRLRSREERAGRSARRL